MRELFKANTLKLLSCAAIGVLLVSCSSSRPTPTKSSGTAVRSQPGLDINRAHKDGAPWWDVDVNKIPDATPTVHTGAYKANPYTVLGKTYYPMQDARSYRAEGTASWYGTKFHGQNTANGELYDLYGMSAAHKTLPLPAYVRVTNLANGRSVILRVNDRGPFYSDRIIDLSYAAAKKLDRKERRGGYRPAAVVGAEGPASTADAQGTAGRPGPAGPGQHRPRRAVDASAAAARRAGGPGSGGRQQRARQSRRQLPCRSAPSPTRMPPNCCVRN